MSLFLSLISGGRPSVAMWGALATCSSFPRAAVKGRGGLHYERLRRVDSGSWAKRAAIPIRNGGPRAAFGSARALLRWVPRLAVSLSVKILPLLMLALLFNACSGFDLLIAALTSIGAQPATIGTRVCLVSVPSQSGSWDGARALVPARRETEILAAGSRRTAAAPFHGGGRLRPGLAGLARCPALALLRCCSQRRG